MLKRVFKGVVMSAVIMAVGLTACRGGAGSAEQSATAVVTDSTPSADKVTAQYAKGFTVDYLPSGVALVEISDPERKGEGATVYRYALTPHGVNPGEILAEYERVEVPLKSVVCMTSLQLSNFIKLGATDLVSGITSTRHLRNATMRRQIEEGQTMKIGIEGNFDKEVIIALDPDVILISPFKRGGYEAISGVGIPMIPHLGYKELSPLGQAEWIKLVGLLTGKTEEANRIFAGIEARYNSLKALTEGVEERPMVMSGEMRGGNWYAVGGESFLAHLFEDAGADYFLKDNHESGGVTLDYETVYANAAQARYWRIVNSHEGEFGYETLKGMDQRYADFKAWRDRGVIYCNMKEVPFYESMPVEPEVILADFIRVFHPELLPDHEPVYYRQLK